MRRTIKAEFETLDFAEKAAIELNKRIPSIKGIHVYPLNPESVMINNESHEKHFTLLPTAIASMNYITALVETDYNFEDIEEDKKRQTSFVEFACDNISVHDAEQILLQMGGSPVIPS